MTDTYILSFDSGKSSGIALGKVTDNSPYALIEAWQLEGGVSRLTQWVRAYHDSGEDTWWVGRNPLEVTTVAEKFTPLQHSNFNLTMDAVEPLRCEGALVALDVMPDYPSPEWRRPQDMYLYGGNTLVEKKKAGRKFLKDNGMYLTGKSVGCKDAHDAQSAIWHGISYAVKVLQHRPTFDMVSDWLDKQD